MKKFLFSLLIVSVSVFASAQQAWSNDPAHSRLGFVVKHLSIADISGNFSNFSVKVITTQPDYSDMKVTLTANVASINTGVEMRDNHLRSADFFDVEKYPELKFVSTGVKKVSDKKFVLTGDLTMHRVTKPVTLDVTYNGSALNMSKKEVFGFHITGVLNRVDFGIAPNFPAQAVSHEIRIVADAEFSKE